MGFPHQFLAVVATADAVLTIAATLNLGILPVPQASAEWIERIAHVTGVAQHVSLWQRVRGGTSASAYQAAAHLSKIVSPPPRKLLFVILAVCLARCSTILTIWSSVVKTIAGVRAGGPGQDVSGQAIGYSAVCVISMLVNLSLLNALFQTRGFVAGTRPDTSIQGILTQYNASSLAAEQLLVSALEWILFVLFIGTNKSALNPRQRSVPSAASSSSRGAALPAGDDSINAAVETQKKKDYGALSDTPQPLASSPTATAAAVPKAEAQSGATLTETDPASTDSNAKTDNLGSVGGSGSEITNNTNNNYNNTNNNYNNKASLDTERNASTLAASTGGLATVSASGDATPTSEDIVDVSSDREQSKLDARDRLQRARENGKVRRRSLWKKIRGKTSLGGSNSESQN